MNITLLIRKAIQRLRRYGLRMTARTILTELFARASLDDFDRVYGTDTCGRAPLWKLRIDSSNARFGRRYETRSENEIAGPLKAVPEDLGQFVFIDLGCGKGRALLVAARLGFKRVIGVEFSYQLVEVARANLALLGVENCEVIHQDAAHFEFPDANLVLYLFNPFTAPVLASVVENLGKAQSRKVYVIYDTPDHGDVLDDSGFLARFEEIMTAAGQVRIWKGVYA